MSPADRIRAVLHGRTSWTTYVDLHRTLTVNHGLSPSDINRGLDALADELEWHHARPTRVRLAPVRMRQLTIGGDT